MRVIAVYKDGEELTSEGGPPLGLFPELVYSGDRALNSIAVTVLPCCRMESSRPGAVSRRRKMFWIEPPKALSSRSAHDIAVAAQRFGQEDDITVVKLHILPVEPCTT